MGRIWEAAVYFTQPYISCAGLEQFQGFRHRCFPDAAVNVGIYFGVLEFLLGNGLQGSLEKKAFPEARGKRKA